ncbi:unnamed protein product [Amoebophrya sp. A25]|nr:unnamed protein product [Amoebophrya sp. A25]|eukprot:GSA25T00024305001.1
MIYPFVIKDVKTWSSSVQTLFNKPLPLVGMDRTIHKKNIVIVPHVDSAVPFFSRNIHFLQQQALCWHPVAFWAPVVSFSLQTVPQIRRILIDIHDLHAVENTSCLKSLAP